ncbi:helix-turn-helix domain-containing protein [Spirillospora sp. NPDC047279]|uniref:ArsR/SmtB family transcription factor n=1 Tax=Spirillospora sp. NPDC047279 TaxID=3155478 RepID=UPI0033DC004F
MSEAPTPLEITDLEALKALAHPRRQRILHHLGLHGPATSATLARALGLNTGATSYHLRELAKYGFVEETPKRGHARERWWRAPVRDLRIPPRSKQSEQMRVVVDEMARLEIADDFEQFLRFQVQRDTLGAWSDAFPHSRGSIRITLEELDDFFEEYIQLVKRYKRSDADTPPGARTVLTRFFAFPAPTEEGSVSENGVREGVG